MFTLLMFTHKILQASHLNCFSIMSNVNIRASVSETEFCFLGLYLIGSTCRNAQPLGERSG